MELKKVDEPWEPEYKGHRWSGWPGAFCLDCFQEDGMEIAVADNAYDPYEGTWRSPEDQAYYLKNWPPECPKKGGSHGNG